jgi:hypothetical protein
MLNQLTKTKLQLNHRKKQLPEKTLQHFKKTTQTTLRSSLFLTTKKCRKTPA